MNKNMSSDDHTNTAATTRSIIQCHYDVLDVPRDADATTIKKAHRKLALKYHPDKQNASSETENTKEDSTQRFRLIQQAYECLSDPSERKWYDQHRDAILKGWSADGDGKDAADGMDMLFDVVPFQHPSCYDGYDDTDRHSFFGVYQTVFENIYEGEQQGWTGEGNIDDMPLHDLPVDFGNSTTEWPTVAAFYQAWESFTSCLSFAWADMYDPREAPNRRVKRAMDDDNKKKRRSARKERNEDVLALVHFVKRRDPRVKAHFARVQEEKIRKQHEQAVATKRKKALAREKREAWRAEAERTMAELEEEDRLAGRVRLADLEDDYDYGGGKRGKKGKNKKKVVESESDEETGASVHAEEQDNLETESTGTEDCLESGEPPLGDEANGIFEPSVDHDEPYDSDVSVESEESEPEVWRCECCRKDFKSEGQMENHLKSKKHKEAFKKYEKKRRQEETMDSLLDELVLES